VFEPEEQIEALDEAACRRLLVSTRFGRLAVVRDGAPRLVVLNHTTTGDQRELHVLFRTTPDAMLVELTEAGPVPAEYEVDSAFPVGRAGWSVIATGRLSREDDEGRIATALAQVEPWALGARDVVLRLDVEGLTGRQVGPL